MKSILMVLLLAVMGSCRKSCTECLAGKWISDTDTLTITLRQDSSYFLEWSNCCVAYTKTKGDTLMDSEPGIFGVLGTRNADCTLSMRRGKKTGGHYYKLEQSNTR